MASGTRDGDSAHLRVKARRAAWRACILAFGWWALLEDDVGGIAFGVVVVLAATIVSLRLCPARAPLTHVRVAATSRLVWHFLVGSIRGGWDVALLALSPRVPVAPAVVSYTTDLAPGPEQQLFTSLINLMPGSLTVEVRDRELRIHVLVDDGELEGELRALERRVARAIWAHTPAGSETHA
ncbi:MAG: Na+/H+ antiporter subunit E [Labilithrix sp.]|nr:Na+/H+ antiporter subunit E [Labilithrix sp.]MBX3215624.1 Na+/H+ antiporter subunit E [Labilithrix sp.]